MKTIDICINGAGPVGATLACRLAGAGFSVLLIDHVALADMLGPHLDGRAYAMSEGSRRVLQQGGVWDHLPRPAQPIRKIAVQDGAPAALSPRNGNNSNRASLLFDAADYPADPEALTAFGWMIEATDLRNALNQALNARCGDLLEIAAPHRAQFEFAPDHAIVTLGHGARYRAQLIIAAEGRQSPLRQQARIPLTRLAYQQSGLVTTITHEAPHEGIALERFLPDGPFARLPLPAADGAPHRSAIVWAAATPRAEYLYNLRPDAFMREINTRLDEGVGRAMQAGRRWLYPLSAQYAHRYHGNRLALIGDAAHGLHPIAGQGLNLGFRDSRILAERVIEARDAGRDFGATPVLQEYQRATRPHNMTMLFACDAMERMFAARSPALRILRRVGMNLLDRKTPVRASFIRNTMGLT